MHNIDFNARIAQNTANDKAAAAYGAQALADLQAGSQAPYEAWEGELSIPERDGLRNALRVFEDGGSFPSRLAAWL